MLGCLPVRFASTRGAVPRRIVLFAPPILMPTTRRTFLAQALGAAGLLSLSSVSALARPSFVISNITHLYPVEVARIAVPQSSEQVAREITAWGGKVAVGGGRYSMGGQTAVAQLEPASRAVSTYALQEYFVPAACFESFARDMAALIRTHAAQVLSVSVRYAKADPVPLLPWAKDQVFSFVIYYKQQTSAAARAAVGEWTRAMIESALRHGGRYYLPYQLHATKAQFERAYPEIKELRRLKRVLDPQGKFSNEMWARYL